jgi:K(+)-stimulated pyrophosphate-energized sodium pump
VTEFVLVLGIHIAALAFAVALGRWVVTRDAGPAELQRLGRGLERAVGLFTKRQYRLVALVAAVLCLMSLCTHAGLALMGDPHGSLKRALWTTVGVLLGAGSTVGIAQICISLGLSAGVRTAAAAGASLDRALSIAVRAGGASALVAEALSALGVGAMFCLIFAIHGGFAAAPGPATGLAFEAAESLSGYALGAVAAALLIQRSGSIYHTSGVGARRAADREDPRNPAVVSELVGDHVGLGVVRTADWFVCSTAANVGAVVFGARALRASDSAKQALALLALPILVRAFGVIACSFGIMVVRTTDIQNPFSALSRGHATTAIVSLGGLAGASFWLAPHWPRYFAAGALGIAASAVAAHLASYRVLRRFAPVREVLESQRAGGAASLTQGLAVGLQSVWPAIALVTIAMTLVWQLGSDSDFGASGRMLPTLTALMAMLASGPYMLAIGTFGLIAENARALARLSGSESEGTNRQEDLFGAEARRRAVRLDDAGFSASAIAQTYLIVVGGLTALLIALALPSVAGANLEADWRDGYPVVIWMGVLGGAFVLAYSGAAMRSAARGAFSVSLEVERELEGVGRQGPSAQGQDPLTPSYRGCVEAASTAALRGALPAAALALLPAPILGIALSLLYHSRDPGLAAKGLTSFVLVTSVTGLGAALAVDGARATLDAARRVHASRGHGPGFDASVSGGALADLLGNSGPAALLLAKATAVIGLAVVPFLA